VYRGGGWFDDAWLCRSASRSWFTPGDRYVGMGFRLSLQFRVERQGE
jgi:formylglycine-generating enzyme required for sulfatase activity